jgi:hypothetical protein
MRTRKQVSLAVLALLVVSSLALAQSKSSGPVKAGKQATLTGVVSDTMCGAKHMMKGKSAAECTRECVKADSDYALVVGQKVYTLKGNASDLDKYAGERVTVKGTVNGDTITAQTITPAKGVKGS